MGMTNYLEEQLGTHIFRDGTYTPPTTLYMALLTTLPTSDECDDEVELATASYDRVAYGPSDAAWSAPVAGDGKFYNMFSIIFPTPGEDWGTIVGWCFYDADTGGNPLFFSALASNKNVPDGAPAPEFNPGAVSFTFD